MNSKVSNERRAISGQPNRGCLGIMQDTRSDNADAETAYRKVIELKPDYAAA